MVRWIIQHVKRRYGEKELKSFVNVEDSFASRVTPLLEAVRTRAGAAIQYMPIDIARQWAVNIMESTAP